MFNRRLVVGLFSLVTALALPSMAAVAADAPVVAGTWTASFDTQVGVQSYTFTFVVNGSQLTGKAKSANGDNAIEEGKVEGDKLSFVENMDYQGVALRIVYGGTVVSADEIRFNRDVGGQGNESFTAKRAK